MNCFLYIIVSSRKPLRKKVADWGSEVAEHPGVYVTKTPVLDRVILIVLNELREEPHNDYFRLFASRKKVRLLAFKRLQRVHVKVPSDISSVLFALRQAYDLEEVIMMDEKMTVDDLLVMGESLRKHALATASVDEYFEGEKGEEARKYAIETASVDERLEGVEPEERLVGLDVEGMQALMKQIEQYLEAQEPKA